MPPSWLRASAVAWISLAAAFASAAMILYDIFGRGHRQRMWIMEPVWPVTALYLGPLGWWAYRRWGRSNSPAYTAATGRQAEHGEAHPAHPTGAAQRRLTKRSSPSSICLQVIVIAPGLPRPTMRSRE